MFQDNEATVVFLDILNDLFKAKIRFNGCKDLPLIAYGSFGIDNSFRSNICKLFQNFGLIKSWKDTSTLHSNNSKKLYQTVIIYINRIKNKLQQQNISHNHCSTKKS